MRPQRLLPLTLFAGAALASLQEANPQGQQFPLIFPLTGPEHEAFGSLDGPKKKLHGRFLWLTDLHPDQFYETYSKADEDEFCHRHKGTAGFYGAETAPCDSPLSLINATFDWLKENVADKVDFVIWTGDSARHDNDDRLPRSEKQVLWLNRQVANRMVDTFGRNDDGNQSPKVIPTFGNNDIMPHNIMFAGPNEWTKQYLDIWDPFIPEEQRHTFGMGGFFYVETIPNKLAVFSLNTLYFFEKNAAADGCIDPEEPGTHQFKWLRIQLQRIRQRGMKAILIGHVPPGRTDSKQYWDETCWQMYTLWMHQFRDIIIGTMYGHMDWDHFMFQDYRDVELLEADYERSEVRKANLDDEIGITGMKSYFTELGEMWASLPKVPKVLSDAETDEYENDMETEKKKKKKKKGKKGKKGKKKLDGPWAESFSMAFVGPSIIPSYYPTIRLFEYNITHAHEEPRAPLRDFAPRVRGKEELGDDVSKKIDALRKKGKKPKVEVPKGPSKSSPPGPAYSPQTFSLTGYVQYFANLTVINNDVHEVDTDKKHKGHKKPHPKEFQFEIEYDTKNDKIYKLKDLTVRSFLDLARRIGKGSEDVEADKKKKKKKKKHHHKHRKHTDLWLTFLRRVHVGSAKDDDIMDKFGISREPDALSEAEDVSYEL